MPIVNSNTPNCQETINKMTAKYIRDIRIKKWEENILRKSTYKIHILTNIYNRYVPVLKVALFWCLFALKPLHSILNDKHNICLLETDVPQCVKFVCEFFLTLSAFLKLDINPNLILTDCSNCDNN